MKRLLWVAGAATLAATAMADSSSLNLNGFGIRLGAYYPFEDDARRVTGTMFNLGLDFRIAEQGRREMMLSAEWLGRSIDGGKGNILTGFVNARQYIGELDFERNRPYIVAGLGVVNLDITTSGYALGLRGGYGVQAPSGVFYEGVLMVTSSKGGVSASGAGINVGYRF